jgi:hypothetical protein
VYSVPVVIPPQETVTVTVTWNTNLPNFVGTAAVAALAQPAIAAYINSIAVGGVILTGLLEQAFRSAVASILPQTALTRLVFAVAINGVGVSPQSGQESISGDPESYFYCLPAGVTVTQG